MASRVLCGTWLALLFFMALLLLYTLYVHSSVCGVLLASTGQGMVLLRINVLLYFQCAGGGVLFIPTDV